MLPATRRLDHDDALLLDFRARVVAHANLAGRPAVILDVSAFYPESGGQLGDRGELGGLTVLDVQIDDGGRVHHVVSGPLPEVGAEVHGRVDGARRRVHRALHTGQHMLSRALAEVLGAETVSARLGESACTVDVDRDALDERGVARAEDLVNAVIDDDLAVRAFFPEPGELARLPLRRAPTVKEHIRVVEIGAFDVTPCGGTHCLRTSQVGLLRVTSVERYKGKARVTFAAGERARRELVQHDAALRSLARDLTCGPGDVAGALDRLRRDAQEAREALGVARARLAEHVAADLLARTAPGAPVIATLDEGGPEMLRAVTARVTASPSAVALLAARSPEGLAVVAARGAQSSFDCGAFLRRAAAEGGGKGGGRPERAEGRLPPDADWAAIAARSLEQV